MYCLTKTSGKYYDAVAHEPYRVARCIVARMRDRSFSEIELMLVIVFKLDFMLPCQTYGINEEQKWGCLSNTTQHPPRWLSILVLRCRILSTSAVKEHYEHTQKSLTFF